LREGMGMVAAGLVLGFIAALLLQRAVASEIYGVRALDPLVFGSVMVILSAVAGGACAAPGWRAMRVDPMGGLRCGLDGFTRKNTPGEVLRAWFTSCRDGLSVLRPYQHQ